MLKNKKTGVLLWAAFALYIMVLLRITVLRHGLLADGFFSGQLHFIPGVNYVRLLSAHQITFAIYQFGGNIGWFIPLGFLLPFITGRPKKPFWIILWGFLLSFMIELSQYIFGTGVSEVDDLLLNTLGASIGFFLHRALWYHINQKKGERTREG